LEPLQRQTDNTWAARFTPLREETITVRLAVDGVVAAQQALVVTGRSPTALDLASSLRQATFTSQGGAVTALVTNNTNLLAYSAETSFLNVPIVDKAGIL
jgi:hypothetical protein